jgi:hypothetical protein
MEADLASLFVQLLLSLRLLACLPAKEQAPAAMDALFHAKRAIPTLNFWPTQERMRARLLTSGAG